jgi:hypothetical protein
MLSGSSETLFSDIPLLFLYAKNEPTFIKNGYIYNQRGITKKTALIITANKGNLGLSLIPNWDYN